MVLWVDQYRPIGLDKNDLHVDINNRLQSLIQTGDFPHILLWGKSGSGKKTRVNGLLRGLYGNSASKCKVTHKQFKIKSKTIDISCITSNNHIEINAADVGNNDRYVIQEVIKEIASTHNVSSTSDSKQFKVVVLTEVDRLSRAAQNALRRTMERYTSTCRIILVCESCTRIIPPLKSRCLPIRLPAPTIQQIVTILSNICQKERFELSNEALELIAEQSDRNLRRAILMCEAYKVKVQPLTTASTDINTDVKACRADWEQFVENIGKLCCEQQNAEQLLKIRGKLYELLVNCIPAEVILRSLSDVLLRRLDDQFKHQLTTQAAAYDHRLAQGSKPIFHLEAFVAKFMAIYKRWLLSTFGYL